MKQLLVVEDSRLIRTTMKRILVEEGFGVVDVSDGEVALQLARQSRPDLIILDMLLPKMGGRACTAIPQARPNNYQHPSHCCE